MVVSYFNSTSNHNRRCASGQRTGVVSYFNSTSNHNDYLGVSSFGGLFLISILHQTTTSYRSTCCLRRCFLFQFYIKPQPFVQNFLRKVGCFLFQFYIKPQRHSSTLHSQVRCFLFQFYIKPQPSFTKSFVNAVVSYFNSTSNHNVRTFRNSSGWVVSYFNSTSNHNWN